MENYFISDIVKATDGELMCGNPNTEVVNFATASQKAEGLMFVPIIGEHTDGHKYMADAFRNGAVATFSSSYKAAEELIREWESENIGCRPIVLVEDTRSALQNVAHSYEGRLSLPKIGVTGSVGKTTTKEMIACALSGGRRVYKTAGNANSQIGVPITVMGISMDDEAAVIEMGMSEEGEMQRLAKLLTLDAAVITNIGVSHIEQLKTKENILKEKWHITDALKKGGRIFLNGDDALLAQRAASLRVKGTENIVTFGLGRDCDCRAEDVTVCSGGISFTAVYGDVRQPVRLNLLGDHNVLNALVAIALAVELGVEPDAAARKLGEYSGIAMRQHITVKDGITYIDDSYNASPDSMRAGINVLMQVDALYRIAVLADMLELGENAEEYHRQVGDYAASSGIDELVVYGELSRYIEYGAEQYHIPVRHFDTLDTLTDYLRKNLKSGDAVLFKGSRGMKLNEAVEVFVS